MNRKCQLFGGTQPCPERREGSVQLQSIMGCRRACGAGADSSWERWRQVK